MMNYLDIHSHILYGVDDGSKSLEMSMEMIDMAYQEGIRVQYATPHFSLDKHAQASKERIERHFEILKAEVSKKYPDYQLYLGSELYYEPGMLEALKNGEALTMAGSRYVLVEFSFGGHYSDLLQGMKELVSARYKPILAHVERYSCLRGNTERMDELKNMGVLFQLNTENFEKSIFSDSYRYAMKIIKAGYIDFLATDAHNKDKRAPRMKKAMGIVEKKLGNDILKKELKI